jgi:uncharacterized protein (TIGR02145 family)
MKLKWISLKSYKMKMKKSKTLLLSILTLTTLILQSCKPDEPDLPDNPLNGRTTAVFNPDLEYGTMNDIEGNIYKTIKIGNQIWMAENLRTTKYKNGESIPTTYTNELWGSADGADLFCNYNNTQDLDTIATYGRLYNWYAVNNENGLAPEGWRIPTVSDWLTLIEYVGGDEIGANALKEVGATHWEDPYESTNSSGFTALPNGWRYLTDGYAWLGYYSAFWTASAYSETRANSLYLFFFGSDVLKGNNYYNNGYAVRCIKD